MALLNGAKIEFTGLGGPKKDAIEKIAQSYSAFNQGTSGFGANGLSGEASQVIIDHPFRKGTVRRAYILFAESEKDLCGINCIKAFEEKFNMKKGSVVTESNNVRVTLFRPKKPTNG